MGTTTQARCFLGLKPSIGSECVARRSHLAHERLGRFGQALAEEDLKTSMRRQPGRWHCFTSPQSAVHEPKTDASTWWPWDADGRCGMWLWPVWARGAVAQDLRRSQMLLAKCEMALPAIRACWTNDKRQRPTTRNEQRAVGRSPLDVSRCGPMRHHAAPCGPNEPPSPFPVIS
jgi:hypothetical protein